MKDGLKNERHFRQFGRGEIPFRIMRLRRTFDVDRHGIGTMQNRKRQKSTGGCCEMVHTRSQCFVILSIFHSIYIRRLFLLLWNE